MNLSINKMKKNFSCGFCNSYSFSIKFQYEEPPKGETKFNLNNQSYKRHFNVCNSCGHWLAEHEIELKNFYTKEYMDSTYSNKILETFEKIISIPEDKSDNSGRIKRIINFKEKNIPNKKDINLLDIGSGLGVFPYAVKKTGWNCTAIDPDFRSVEHIKKRVGVNAIHGNFMDIKLKDSYDIITFNKVLEHVIDPKSLLKKAKTYLGKDGFIYIEVPDAEKASAMGKEREEFFIDHLHVFSKLSLELMCKDQGFKVVRIGRLREPSDKFTLFVFLSVSA